MSDTPKAVQYLTPTGLETQNPPEVFVGAGDIASCSKTGDSQTATLLDGIAGEVFMLGDAVYENGTDADFTNCYGPTWGRHKARTHPAPGNHEYNTTGASGYYDYFGAAAGTRGEGYYSFDLGAWHIIVLNSNISRSVGSPQDKWLKADLAAHPNLCTLAYFHHPLYSSDGGTGTGGVTYSSVRPFYDALYAAGADLVLAGHRHFYERIAPIKPDGTPDPDFGLRQMIIGSGGIGTGGVTDVFPASEVRDGTTFGVVKFYLYEDSYAWKFVPVAGKTFSDSGSSACHPAPSSGGVSASRSSVSTAPATIAASSGGTASTVTVTARDVNGNPVSGAAVTLSATGSGNTVTQPSAPTNASGVATGTVSSTAAGTKTISATAAGVTVTQTASVTVTPAAASTLAFTGQPTNTAAGATIAPAVTVEVRDAFGNRATDASNAVTLAIGTNPAGGTLAGTAMVSASGGVAAFSTLSIDAPGSGYTLAGSASGLTGATSGGFDVTPVSQPVSASQSSVDAAPTSISTGGSTSTITVTARDASGSPVSGAVVTLSATGSGNTLVQPAAPTNAGGAASGTLSSTVAEVKTVSAVVDGVPITGTAAVTVASAGTATIDQALLTAGNNPTNQKVFTTASIAPAANTLITVAVVGHNSTTAPPSPAITGGGMSAWTEVVSATFDTLPLVHKRITLFRAMSGAPGSGPITITWSANVSNCQWIVSQWSGVDPSGVNGSGAIVQTTSARADRVSTLTAALGSLASSDNVAIGVVGNTATGPAVDPAPGFSEIAEQSSGESPRSVLEAQWAAGHATIAPAWSGLLNAAILAAELRAAGGP